MRVFKSNPVRRVEGTGAFRSHYKPAPHVLAYWPQFEAQVQPEPLGRGNDFFLKDLARCHIWTGKVDQSGKGFINIKGAKVNVQKFAYEYHFSLVPKFDYVSFGNTPVHMVARCVAAGTRNCVAKDHLGIIHAREPYCPPTTKEERAKLRWLYYHDEVGQPFEAMAISARLPEARLARILVGLEGWEGEEFIIPSGPRETW